MKRVLTTATLAACALCAGMAMPAAAQTAQPAPSAPPAKQPMIQRSPDVAPQPIPPQGPAIDPAIYKVAAGAKTIAVDCDDPKQTLANAIADKSTTDLNIVFSGTCKEHLILQRDGVAIRGKDTMAAISGGIEVISARRVLLEGFTCRDNTQLEACIASTYGANTTLHNIKVTNSAVRGVLFFNANGLVDGLTVEKTISTSMLIRASQVRLEGDLSFSNTVEGGMTIDNVSSVFSKNGNISARDCGAGILLQSNSNFYAPFASFSLNHNTYAGLMIITQGTFSYGGTFSAKNNTQAGILVDDGSSFSPFTNISGGSSLTLENNGNSGVIVLRGSYAELANVTANTGSNYGVMADDGRLRIGKGVKITDNKKADVRLQFGSHAVFLEGATFGTFTCDGTELVKGTKTPCTPDPDSKTAPKPTSTSTKQDGTQSQKR